MSIFKVVFKIMLICQRQWLTFVSSNNIFWQTAQKSNLVFLCELQAYLGAALHVYCLVLMH